MIAAKYGSGAFDDVLAGIELLNEPLIASLVGGRGAIEGYYQDGFGIVRNKGTTPVIIHDGFINPPNWNRFLTGQGDAGAIVDHHEYQVFSNADVALSPADHIMAVCTRAQQWGEGQDKFLIVGEWSAAMTDCAPALNGYDIGARYDGTYPSSTYVGSCATINFIEQWTQEQKAITTSYIRAQIDIFEQKTQGWIFWNFKTEATAEWDLFRLLDAGVFPSMNGYQGSTQC